MGKLIDQITMPAAKAHVPTSDQLRIAQLLSDKSLDSALMQEKIRKMMELTRCDENSASYALHDSGYDVDEAVAKIFDGKFMSACEWKIQEGKKSKNKFLTCATSSSMNNNDEVDEYNECGMSNEFTAKKSNTRKNFQRGEKRTSRGGARKNNENVPQQNNTNNNSSVGADRNCSNRGRAVRGRGANVKQSNDTNDRRENNEILKDLERKNVFVTSSATTNTKDCRDYGDTLSKEISCNQPTYASKLIAPPNANTDSDSKLLLPSVTTNVAKDFDVGDDWNDDDVDFKSIPKEFHNSRLKQQQTTTADLIVVSGDKNESTSLFSTPPSTNCSHSKKTSLNNETTGEVVGSGVASTSCSKSAVVTEPKYSTTKNIDDDAVFQSSDVKVLMPPNFKTYNDDHIDIEFGEFGNCSTTKNIFDFVSSSTEQQRQPAISSTTTTENLANGDILTTSKHRNDYEIQQMANDKFIYHSVASSTTTTTTTATNTSPPRQLLSADSKTTTLTTPILNATYFNPMCNNFLSPETTNLNLNSTANPNMNTYPISACATYNMNSLYHVPPISRDNNNQQQITGKSSQLERNNNQNNNDPRNVNGFGFGLADAASEQMAAAQLAFHQAQAYQTYLNLNPLLAAQWMCQQPSVANVNKPNNGTTPISPFHLSNAGATDLKYQDFTKSASSSYAQTKFECGNVKQQQQPQIQQQQQFVGLNSTVNRNVVGGGSYNGGYSTSSSSSSYGNYFPQTKQIRPQQQSQNFLNTGGNVFRPNETSSNTHRIYGRQPATQNAPSLQYGWNYGNNANNY